MLKKGFLTAALFVMAAASHDALYSQPLSDEPQTTGKSLNLQRLNALYRNTVVMIEFTPVTNQNEIKLNPGKSEQYGGSDAEGGHGSGFFISGNEILTNAHVVEDARRGSITIRSPATGNVKYKAEVTGIGSSSTIDLAILRLPSDELMRLQKHSGLKRIPFLRLGNSDSLIQSDPLVIFGFPTNSDELKVIQAEVTGRQYQNYRGQMFIYKFQFLEVGPGGVVQSGNSGGPALDQEGSVVGIPTLGDWMANQGWLIPVSIVKLFLERIRNNQIGKISLEIPDLGVSLARNAVGNLVLANAPEDISLFELGVMVRDIEPESLAEKWGIKRGDIILGFANKQKRVSYALDFEGFTVVTGPMAKWPQHGRAVSNLNAAKLHLGELMFTSSIGDEITLWILRGPAGVFTITRTIKKISEGLVPVLGLYELPDYEYWGDLVAQDFNSYNTAAFGVPVREIIKGGVLVTYVEPNSLASHSGLLLSDSYGYDMFFNRMPRMHCYGPGVWYIIDSLNGKPVSSISQFRSELRAAENRFDSLRRSPSYKPEKRFLYSDRYVQFSVRTSSSDGECLSFNTTMLIDDALECSNRNLKLSGK